MIKKGWKLGKMYLFKILYYLFFHYIILKILLRSLSHIIYKIFEINIFSLKSHAYYIIIEK